MDNLSRKKRGEYSEATQAALKLGENWRLRPGNENKGEPDFLVTHQKHTFGLELTTCHIGELEANIPKKGGSPKRQRESFNEKWLRSLLDGYEASSGITLRLDYLGPASDQGKAAIIKFFERENFEALDFLDRRSWRKDGISISAYRAKHSVSVFVNDRVGWMHEGGKPLQEAINKKSLLLPKYRQACEDIRLLVVADRIYNSGKLILPDGFRPNLEGFDVVYFFSYPEKVTPFFKMHPLSETL